MKLRDTSKPGTDGPPARVLVLGGGFVCSHVAKCLAGDGAEVTVFSRSFSPLIADDCESMSLVWGDVRDDALLPQLISRHDIVVHGAASSTPARAREHAAATMSSTLLPVATVLSIMRDQGGGRIALLSSGGTVYGEPERFPTPEEHPLRPISEHGANFALAEQLVEFAGRAYGVEAQILRLANVYGPGQRAEDAQGVVAHWLRAIADREPVSLIGSMEIARDFVFAEDAARAVVAAVTHGRWPAIYNIGSERAHSLAEILAEVKRVVDREFAVEEIPARSVDVPKTQLHIGQISGDTGWLPTTSIAAGIEQTWRALDGERADAAAPRNHGSARRNAVAVAAT